MSRTSPIMLAALAVFAISGCATPTFQQDGTPYIIKALGPNVWVRVPDGGLNLHEAIDRSTGWAIEHCQLLGEDLGTHFVAADRAIMDKSEYEVTWRCCRAYDECCLKPQSQSCSQD